MVWHLSVRTPLEYITFLHNYNRKTNKQNSNVSELLIQVGYTQFCTIVKYILHLKLICYVSLENYLT